MNNVIQLKPCANAATALRNIADRMESGDISASTCTIIAGEDIFHCGVFDDERSVTNAIFDMTFGIQKLMRPAIDASFE